MSTLTTLKSSVGKKHTIVSKGPHLLVIHLSADEYMQWLAAANSAQLPACVPCEFTLQEDTHGSSL